MCGFVVLYDPVGSEIAAETLERMTTALAHRGPDDFSYAAVGASQLSQWRERAPAERTPALVALGHRRLSIIDLSEAGRQPFVSPDGRFVMVYNGEVYNYIELRRELEAAGVAFRTDTDTEVVLAAFAHWGPDCFRKFNGMWAIVVWDRRERVLTASRDRIGIKPLFYHRRGATWAFASEVKALLAHPGIDARPDADAVVTQLAVGDWPAPGRTFFESIEELEPGTCLTIDERGGRTERFWQLPDPGAAQLRDLDETCAALSELFEDAVRLRLRSDVRVGTMLSGGVDSTSIVRTMLELSRAAGSDTRAVGDSIQAVTASFPGEPMDESELVRKFCDGLGLTVHELHPLEEPDPQTLLFESVRSMEVPINHPAPMINSLLMRRARAAGVIVVLDGHGSDELFAGYPDPYGRVHTATCVKRLQLARAFQELRGSATWQGRGWKASLADVVMRLAGRRDRFDESTLRWVGELAAHNPASGVGALADGPPPWSEVPGRSPLDQMLRYDLVRKIVPRWLVIEDRTSMQQSVEVRVPFLDHRLVELACAIPDSMKIHHGRTKYVLRKAMDSRLPDFILWGRRKAFFPRPDLLWLRSSLAGTVDSLLLAGDARVGEYLPPESIRRWVEAFRAGDHGLRQKIWSLLNTEIWLREFTA